MRFTLLERGAQSDSPDRRRREGGREGAGDIKGKKSRSIFDDRENDLLYSIHVVIIILLFRLSGCFCIFLHFIGKYDVVVAIVVILLNIVFGILSQCCVLIMLTV